MNFQKFLTVTVAALVVTLAPTIAFADKTTDQYKYSFVKKKHMPDAGAFLFGPPAKGTFLYSNDSLVYENSKKLRTTSRGDTAYSDAIHVTVADYMNRFGAAIGLPLNEADYPELAKLMTGTIHDIRGSISKVKKEYARHRPYQDFGERSLVPEEEDPTDYTSYPSGHAVRGWGLALLFVALAPDYEQEILRVGYEIGQSRVIAGFHYQSDVDAARLAASAGFARLCADKEFLETLHNAREEIKKALKKK